LFLTFIGFQIVISRFEQQNARGPRSIKNFAVKIYDIQKGYSGNLINDLKNMIDAYCGDTIRYWLEIVPIPNYCRLLDTQMSLNKLKEKLKDITRLESIDDVSNAKLVEE